MQRGAKRSKVNRDFFPNRQVKRSWHNEHPEWEKMTTLSQWNNLVGQTILHLHKLNSHIQIFLCSSSSAGSSATNCSVRLVWWREYGSSVPRLVSDGAVSKTGSQEFRWQRAFPRQFPGCLQVFMECKVCTRDPFLTLPWASARGYRRSSEVGGWCRR